jgi:hypothetical protein
VNDVEQQRCLQSGRFLDLHSRSPDPTKLRLSNFVPAPDALANRSWNSQPVDSPMKIYPESSDLTRPVQPSESGPEMNMTKE